MSPWTVEQTASVRAALPERYAALADIGAGLGLRQGEAFGLALEDIDFLRRVVHVRRQVRIVRAKLVLAPPKGGKERDVPLPDSVALRLSAHVAAWPPVTASLPWKVPDGKQVTVRLLFTTREHKPLNRNYFNSFIWKAALKAADLPQTRENGSTRCVTTSRPCCCPMASISALWQPTSATPTPDSRSACIPTSCQTPPIACARLLTTCSRPAALTAQRRPRRASARRSAC